MKEFVLSDESKNSNGFKVLTDGINLKRFLQNPVMFFNHDRSYGIIGRWENIYVKDRKILASPVFDLKDPFAAKIAGKVEDGFIKAASIGADDVNMGVVGGENVVTSCSVYECSVCDIPSNENALALYMGDRIITDVNEIIRLSKSNNKNKMEDLRLIIEALGLPDNASVDDVIEAIKRLKQMVDPVDIVENAVKMKFVLDYEKEGLMALSYSDPTSLSAYLERRKKEVIKERKAKGEELIKTAMRSSIINNDNEGLVRKFWLDAFINDYETTKHVLESLPERQLIYPLIQQSNKGNGNWTLSDYRKFAPQELKNNPRLYQTLLDQENEKTKK